MKKDVPSVNLQLRKEIKRILVSYYFYSVLTIVYRIGKYYFETGTVYPDIKGFLITTVTFEGIGTLWFLSALFFSFIIVRSVTKIRNPHIQILIMIIVFSLGMSVSGYIKELFLNECFRNLLSALLRGTVLSSFLFIGCKYQSLFNCLIRYLEEKNSILLLLIIVGCICLLLPFAAQMSIDYHLLNNGIFGLNIILGLIGTVMILAAAVLLNRADSRFSSLGTHSLFYMFTENLGLISVIKSILLMFFGDGVIRKCCSLILYIVIMCVLTKYIAPVCEKTIKRISA